MTLLFSLLLGLLAQPQPPKILGVALSPHFESVELGLRFDRMIDEIADLGATHVSIVTQWTQARIDSVAIAPRAGDSQPDAVIRRLIRRAHAKGLRVMLFPILWVRHREMGQWRGTLRPRDEGAWWVAYRRFILHHARLASEEKVALLSVGSEFASLERREIRWRALIADTRALYEGELVYSANWDHYERVPFWDALDYVGMTAYHELTDRNDASEAELTGAWRRVVARLEAWHLRAGLRQPILITEVGDPSTDGGARHPWNYTLEGPVDLEEQRRAYQAFRDAWRGSRALGGVFFWNWFGKGGPDDRHYTPRGKPAEQILRHWFAGARK